MNIKTTEPTKEQKSAIRRAKKALKEFKKLGLIAFASEGTLEVHHIENYDNATNVDSGFGGLFVDDEQIQPIDDLGEISH